MLRSVRCDEAGVSLVERRGEAQAEEKVSWDRIGAVVAYKQDCYAYDKIYIALVDDNGRVKLLVSEDDTGYKSLIENLPAYLSGCLAPEAWFQRVAFPAFETQATELYRSASKP